MGKHLGLALLAITVLSVTFGSSEAVRSSRAGSTCVQANKKPKLGRVLIRRTKNMGSCEEKCAARKNCIYFLWKKQGKKCIVWDLTFINARNHGAGKMNCEPVTCTTQAPVPATTEEYVQASEYCQIIKTSDAVFFYQGHDAEVCPDGLALYAKNGIANDSHCFAQGGGEPQCYDDQFVEMANEYYRGCGIFGVAKCAISIGGTIADCVSSVASGDILACIKRVLGAGHSCLSCICAIISTLGISVPGC